MSSGKPDFRKPDLWSYCKYIWFDVCRQMFGTGLQQIYLISFVKDCGVFLAFGMAVIWTQLIQKKIPNHHFISVESFSEGLHLLYTNINNTWMHLCCAAVVIKRYLVLLAYLERNTLPFAILNLDLFLQDFPACFIHKNNQGHWRPKRKLVRESNISENV